MAGAPNPFAYWANAVQLSHLMLEAQSVVAMRVMGMYGVWSVADGEDARMVSEKVHAMHKASSDATRAAFAGHTPDQIAAAAIKPFRQKTRANAKRLKKRGLKIPKK